MKNMGNSASKIWWALPSIIFILAGCSNKSKGTDAYCGVDFHLSKEDGYEADKIFTDAFFSGSSISPGKLTNVYLDGNSIVYDGPLFYESLLKVQEIYNKNHKVDRIKINSRGGVTLVGLCFGEFVHKNNLDVEVTGRVFSSAANYILPAGRRIYLHKYSIVGYHGGENSVIYKDLATDKIIQRLNGDSEPQTKGQAWEKSFYMRLGVNPALVTAGQDGKYESLGEEYIGWTYTLSAFKYMNITNIEMIDGYWRPNTDFGNGAHLFVIDSKDLKSK
ncbi:hypothetical protein ACTVOR_14890 [Serratia nevei]|uniref:hypothetical protein n=1 Tax=Serratia nevei TaxID=2703794 RepID=UPI003FA687DF